MILSLPSVVGLLLSPLVFLRCPRLADVVLFSCQLCSMSASLEAIVSLVFEAGMTPADASCSRAGLIFRLDSATAHLARVLGRDSNKHISIPSNLFKHWKTNWREQSCSGCLEAVVEGERYPLLREEPALPVELRPLKLRPLRQQ